MYILHMHITLTIGYIVCSKNLNPSHLNLFEFKSTTKTLIHSQMVTKHCLLTVNLTQPRVT